MAEKNIIINSHGLKLEARLTKGDVNKRALIAHPHPLYGGNLLNNVVRCVLDTLAKASFTAVRFNFRGSGKSEGVHTGGIDETKDILGVYEYLTGLFEGGFDAVLAGYSFGATVLYHASKKIDKKCKIFLISPPFEVMEFNTNNNVSHHKYHVISGDDDEFFPLGDAKNFSNKINASLDIIKNCNHFYLNKEDNLSEIISKWLI
jgi:alpha/beta superfamily hydrolase